MREGNCPPSCLGYTNLIPSGCESSSTQELHCITPPLQIIEMEERVKSPRLRFANEVLQQHSGCTLTSYDHRLVAFSSRSATGTATEIHARSPSNIELNIRSRFHHSVLILARCYWVTIRPLQLWSPYIDLDWVKKTHNASGMR